MSSFLGPIHFWLYEKIKIQEELTIYFYNAAIKNGWFDEKDSEAALLVKKRFTSIGRYNRYDEHPRLASGMHT